MNELEIKKTIQMLEDYQRLAVKNGVDPKPEWEVKKQQLKMIKYLRYERI